MKIGDKVNVVDHRSGAVVIRGEVMAISKGYALVDGVMHVAVFDDARSEVRARVPVSSCRPVLSSAAAADEAVRRG